MAERNEWVSHIESFVDTSRTSSQQASSLNAIASLLKNDVITIEALVREMEMYLTTTDNIIRARGIILLAELLALLTTKALDDATVHSLIAFFTERLADWKALRGALVGCLALLRRKANAGVITRSDARDLCFELLECLLERYPDAVVPLGDDLVYGICEAVDGEKDPQCLMLTFHIIEILAKLFPDPCGPVANFAGDLFDILGCYFPIHFTHAKGEDVDIKRDSLSMALMQAFSSTPLFEPFAVPLLLEKLSSSLPLAKVDSLKYLSHCSLKYGPDRMAKHAGAIWSSLKDVICTSIQEPSLPLAPESLDGPSFHINEIVAEALALLQRVNAQNDGLYLNYIFGDEDINMVISTINNFRSSIVISLQSKQTLFSVGCILSVSAKCSNPSCNKVIERYLPILMDNLGLSTENSSAGSSPASRLALCKSLNFGALFLCIELLIACRDLAVGSNSVSSQETWFSMLWGFSSSMTKAFSSALLASITEDAQDADIVLMVKGLQVLATFPGGFLLISKSIYEEILMALLAIITNGFNRKTLWGIALKALVSIASYTDEYHETEKATIYTHVVVEKLVSLMSLEECNMPVQLRLEATVGIGLSGTNYMLRVIQGLEEAIFSLLAEVHGNLKSADALVHLLECYSNQVIPWVNAIGGLDEIPLRFSVNYWSYMESINFSMAVQERKLLNAATMAMKLAIAICSVESQKIIIQKAYGVLSAISYFHLNEPTSLTIPLEVQGFQPTQSMENVTCKDEWLISSFASVIIAARPTTNILHLRAAVNLFMIAFLNGHVQAAQALGSLINKMHLGRDINDCSLDEVMDLVFNSSLWGSLSEEYLRSGEVGNSSEMDISKLCLDSMNDRLVRTHVISGLSWIGKGLLMRGHEKVKNVIMILLRCLLSNGKPGTSSLQQSLSQDSEQDLLLKRSVADAFHTLLSDSDVCLNRKFHATVKPLYKQRFFNTIIPILLSLLNNSYSSTTRLMIYRAFGHVVSDTPLVAVMSEAKKLLPMLLEGLSMLSEDFHSKDIIYNLLLVLSGILTDKTGQEAALENVHTTINCLTRLISYPHMMLVRETAIQCIAAMSELKHARIYPMRLQISQALSKALDDPKRDVRREAVRCRQAWASIASRSLYS
ncbi:MMS19, C-terminal [Dillenia turbinata]|uniref:MMS19 nucleotide excision repair protein n=1 Tax=Dillenia turbinata TaxID=194707 RepID=A0AAN8YVR9_9MAGN